MRDGHKQKSRSGEYKLWFDYFILIVVHVSIFPLWIVLWIVIPVFIWIGDRGPIFYRQERAGKNGKPFKILKFRTMVFNADQVGPAWTTQNDPRVTKIGRILRRTALDELPEILSVLRRDMSLVGPRALDIVEQKVLEQQIPDFKKRLEVLPGLTGLAQVYDLSDDAHIKLRHDIEYLDRMSPWLDIKLLLFSLRNTLTARWDSRIAKPK